MRVHDLVPEIGTEFDWEIEEILERMSEDLYFYYDDFSICRRCGETFESGYEQGSADSRCTDECEQEALTIPEAWDQVLERKRYDDHFDELLDVIEEDGFTQPLTAYERNGQLILCDGHHRLAAALDLGLRTVPVQVHEKRTVAADSGTWSRDRIWDLVL